MLLADLPVPSQSAGTANEVVDDVLSRPEFAGLRPSLLDRLRDWLLERIADLVGAGQGTGSLGAWAVGLLLLAVVGFVAWRVTRGVRPDPVSASPVAGVARRRPAEWRAEAVAREAAGEWRSALRCRWRGLVADLADGGVVEEAPGRTAGEYRRQVARHRPSAAGEFTAATALFEDAWYGLQPTGADESARFRALADRVLVSTGERR